MASQKVHLRRCASPSSLRRTTQVRLTREVLRAGSRETRESFLRSHLFGDFLRDHPWEIAERLSQETGKKVIAARDGMTLDIDELRKD